MTFAAKSMPVVDAIIETFARLGGPLTVRQIYYQILSRGLVSNVKNGYQKVARILRIMRKDGTIEYSDIADRSTPTYQVATWGSPRALIDADIRDYRRDLWLHMDTQEPSIWIEKDAIAGVLKPLTDEYRVELIALRGYASLTHLHGFYGDLVYYLGDHDPSGENILETCEYELPDVEFTKLAILPEDIERFNLPPLPAKKADPRYGQFTANHGDACVELDALPPDELCRRVKEAIERHIDWDEWNREIGIEESERNVLRDLRVHLDKIYDEEAEEGE